jgi:HEAT repeat protein
MRRKTLSIVSALILTGILSGLPLPSSIEARQKAAPKDPVGAILLEFPAETALTRDAAAAKIVALGPGGVAGLCAGLEKPGEGDDSLVRFALDAVAVYVGREGAEKERRAFSAGLLRAIRLRRDVENRAFLLSLVQRVGRGEAVKPVAAFLRTPDLTGPAVRALVSIGLPEAEAPMIRALASLPAGPAAEVVQGLGEMRSQAAVNALLPMSGADDPRLRGAALDALAAIGHPDAMGVLEKVSVTARAEERERAAARFLLFARRLAAGGHAAQARAICRSFLDHYDRPGEGAVRGAALELLVSTEGAAVLDELKLAAVSPDREFRSKALSLVEAGRGSWNPDAWLEILKTATPDVQADLLGLFGRKKESSALPAVRERLRAEDRDVRLAAIEARAGISGGDLEDLLPLLERADEAEARALKDAFLTAGSRAVVDKAAAVLASASAPAKVALIELLAERQVRDQAAAVLSQTRSGDPGVRAAALAALDKVARPSEISALIDLIAASTAAPETTLLQGALVAAALQIPDPASRAEAILAVLEKTEGPKRADFVRPLARIGGPKALAAVVAETRSSDPQVQAVAVFALANWPDATALPELWTIGRTSADRKSRSLALQGIARLVIASASAPEKKLAALEEAMTLTAETDQKNAVLSGFAGLRTAEALAAAARYLDDPALRARAAQAAMRIALPAPGADGLKGLETARILKKAALFIESDYDRVDIERYADGLLVLAGFRPLFNGKDLSGWKGLVADPPNRAKMTAAEGTKAQAEADADMRRHWRVLEGILEFDGQGHSLCTGKDYRDFEMFVDWRIEPKGDSGIYLRGSPQVQIWDPAQWPEGSGGLYNNQKNPKDPLVKADRPVGEWNTFFIKMTGERVTVALNGVLVVDDVVMENYWERDKPIYPAGQIELQAHSTPLHFKNIYLREIAAAPEEAHLEAEEQKAGFVRLFNGVDLAGWAGDTKGYVVENGAIVVSPASGGNLYTEKEYGDLHLRFEFKLTPGANNGIGIRTPPVGDAAYLGMEIQVLDDSADQYKDLKPYQFHGSVYGVVPARRGFQKPVGEWNAEEIIVRGRRITVILNGETIVDADLDEASTPQTVDGREHPGLRRTSGHVAFCGHGSRVEFRNLRIKEIR